MPPGSGKRTTMNEETKTGERAKGEKTDGHSHHDPRHRGDLGGDRPVHHHPTSASQGSGVSEPTREDNGAYSEPRKQRQNVGDRNGLYVYNKTRETFLATEVNMADTYWSRLVGLLGKTKRWSRPGRGLWIVPSCGVHTIGMLFPIDVIFLDKESRVVHLQEYVRPFRISSVCLKAASVLEVPVYTIHRSGTQIGDRLEIAPAR
jgi:uncharacterized protein